MSTAFGFGMGGLGLVSLIAIVAMLVFWGLVITALVLGVRWLIRADQRNRLPPTPPTPASSPSDTPLEVLQHRYAKGEIDEEEYERRRKTLAGG